MRATSRPRVFVTWAKLRRVLAVLVPTLAYILGIQFLGIYVASALFIGAFMRKGGGYGVLGAPCGTGSDLGAEGLDAGIAEVTLDTLG